MATTNGKGGVAKLVGIGFGAISSVTRLSDHAASILIGWLFGEGFPSVGMVIWPDAMSAQNSMAAVSGGRQGSAA